MTPVDGKLHYDEGIHIGYRAWLKNRVDPAYPFGHGLGYTRWSLLNFNVRQHRGVGHPQPREVAELGGLRRHRVGPGDHAWEAMTVAAVASSTIGSRPTPA